MLKRLEPAVAQAKARQGEESDARIAEERKQQQAMEAAVREKMQADRRRIQQIERTGRDESGQIVDLKRVPDEELQNIDVEAEGITSAQLEQERERRMRAEMESQLRSEQDKGASDDLLTVLKRIKLPSIDPTMGSELTDLRNEWANFGSRQQIFSPGEGSLDTKAEALRNEGFDDIQTPADVIEFAKRALRGEQIRPTWRSGNDQVSFARDYKQTEPSTAMDDATVRDFEARFNRIAPGLAMDYRVLMGDPTILHQLGVKPSQLTGTERAAFLHRRKIFWFLQQNLRADSEGTMPERLRRDVLHETTHAWLDTVDEDTKAELRQAWQDDVSGKGSGWLADVRRRGVKLRAGVQTDWQEYWSERLAEENDRWAARREAVVAQDRSVLAQVAYEFRTWLQEAIELLRQAFTRTKRYNVEFRKFLDQGARFVAPETEAQPIAAAREGRSTWDEAHDHSAGYIGTIRNDEVSARRSPLNNAGHASFGMRGDNNWRYNVKTKTLYFWETPTSEQKAIVTDYLERKGERVNAVKQIGANGTQTFIEAHGDKPRKSLIIDGSGDEWLVRDSETFSAVHEPFKTKQEAEEWTNSREAAVLIRDGKRAADNTDFAREDQTQTPEFKRWFRRSAVKDENGNPTVVYHGTPTAWGLGDFNTFDAQAARKAFNRPPGMDQVGSWFSSKPDMDGAQKYAGSSFEAKPAIYPVYLSIQRPFLLSFPEFLDLGQKIGGWKNGDPKGRFDGVKVRQYLQERGWDGILFEENNIDGGNHDVWVAFEPTQIKSAIGNRGTFDAENPDIRFASEERSSAEIQQAIEENRRAIESLQESNEQSDDVEARGRDLEAKGKELQRELVDAKRRELAAAFVKQGSKLPGAPKETPPAPIPAPRSTKPVLERIGKEKTLPTSGNQDIEKIADRWRHILPTFQGGKEKMTVPVTQAIRAEFNQAERERIQTIEDYFGGGGSWGLYLALTNFREAKKLIVHEYEPARLDKIRFFHEKGDQFRKIVEEKLKPALEQAVAAMKADGVTSANALSTRLQRIKLEDPDLRAAQRAIVDYGEASFGSKTDATGKKTADAALEAVIRNVAKQAEAAHEGAKEFRSRGGTIEYQSGDSYAAKPHPGDTVVSIVDPPYYKTTGYQEAIVGVETYAKTHDLLAKLAEAKNNIIYTDEGWWLRPDQQGKSDPQGERILSSIVDFFSKFDVVDSKIANRHETLGIHHGNDPITHIPRLAGAVVSAAPGGRQAERRVSASRGILDRAKQAVLGLAGRAQDEAAAVRSEPAGNGGPAGELSDRKTALLQELADLNGRIKELEQKNGSRPALRSYLGQRNDVRIALDEEFPKWRREHAALAAGDATTVAINPTTPAAPTLPAEGNARLKELREALNHWQRQARADVVGADSWVTKYRSLLDSEFPGWEKRPVQQVDRVEEPPIVDADPSDLEREATGKPERQYDARGDIYDQVEGHTAQPESWLERKWKFVQDTLRTARGAIPELPAFADNKEQVYAKLRQGFKMLARGTPRVWKEAADQTGEIVKPLLEAGKLDADRYNRLGQLQAKRLKMRAANQAIPAAMEQEIAALRRDVDREPYGLFQNLALYLDLKWRAENLMDNQGNPIVLPFGINSTEINTRLADLKQKLAASPHKELIVEALKKHQAMVKAIADDLKQRDLRMPDELRNPFYFPHVILEKDGKAIRSALERVKMDTADDFRGYLQKPVGSMRPIETDYAKAMYYHLVAVGSHNLRADIVRDYWAKYNEMDAVRERAKELTQKYGRGVNWREAFHTEWAPAGYKLPAPADQLPLHPDPQIDRDTLARRLGVILTDEPLQPQLEKLGLKGVKIQPEDIREALAAGEREYWVVPEKVAEALNGILRRESNRAEGMLGKPFEMVQAMWKRNILFAPWNYPRYEFNNTMADLEKLMSADPKVYTYLSQAAKEVRQFIEEGKGTADVRAAFKLGVLDTITASELNDLSALRQFEELQTSKQKLTKQLLRRASTLFVAGPRATTDLSRLREATFRYAKFKSDMERMRAGSRPVYAGAYWRDIEAITDTTPGANDAMYKKAAEISLATFGDYHNISVLGNELRRYLVPFYSWTEINFRYHANLLHNLADMTAAGELSKAEATKSVAKAAATFSTRAATAVLLRLALPYVAVALWNGSGWRRDLEDTLSDEDKRRFHIIVGKDKNGRTMVVYAQTALGDIAKWFSGQEAARLTMDLVKGRTNLGTAAAEWSSKFPRDFANNVWQVGPITRAFIAGALRKSTFPDVTDARTIPANEVKWAVLGQMTDQVTAEIIRRAADKDYLASKDVKDWAQQIVLQVRRRDPEQWAFFDIKDQAARFLEQKTGTKRDTQYDAPDQQVLRNFRRAIYRGDVENALRFYDRLLELGYTSERFKSSIQAQDPLAALPKDQRREFVEALSPADRYQLQQAYRYYVRMSETRGAEHALFPSERLGAQRRQNYQPRYDRLTQSMDAVDQMDDAQLNQRAEMELRRSLRPAIR